MTVSRILFGNYGNGTFGIKTSTPGNDVTVLADDNDLTKRSFNSEWDNVVKIKSVGSVASDWEPFYWYKHGIGSAPGATIYGSYTNASWRPASIEVYTGLTSIPIWEERIYNSATKEFNDDYVDGTVGGTGPALVSSSYSGARSYFKGSSLYLEPGANNSPHVAAYTTAAAEYYSPPNPAVYPPYPPPPALPTKPALLPIRSFYVLYSNNLGTPS